MSALTPIPPIQEFHAPNTFPANQMEVPGTDLPPIGTLADVSKADLYPHLKMFYDTSPTFKTYWDKSDKTQRQGQQCDWNSIAANSCLMAQIFKILLLDLQASFHERNPYVTAETRQALRGLVADIETNPDSKFCFYLMIYARDFGWAETNKGQGHQKAGMPIIEQILKELGKNELIEDFKLWIENHSMPVESFLGEPATLTLNEIITHFSRAKTPGLLNMFVLLNYLEVSCIKLNVSAAYETLSQHLCQLANANTSENKILSIYTSDDRLRRLCFSKMCLSTTTNEEWEDINEKSAARYGIACGNFKNYDVSTQACIRHFLMKVNLHYVAGMFPQMSPLAILSFIKITAEVCKKHDFKIVRVINNDAGAAKRLEELLLNRPNLSDEQIGEKYIKLTADGILEWNPPLGYF